MIGLKLGIPSDFINRHPFPGPGLAIRIIGEVTKEKLEILRKVDAIYIEELRRNKIYNDIWQAFAVFYLFKVSELWVMRELMRMLWL